VLEHISLWTSERAKRVAHLNGVKANAFFAVKAYLKDMPYICLLIGLGFSVLILGFTIRIFEKRREYVFNNFYLIVITMTTIGYGEVYPVTYIGRIICIIACVWGVFLISLFTVSLMKTTHFTEKETKVYDEIVRREKLSKAASELLAYYLSLAALRNQNGEKQRRSELLIKLISQATRFNIKRLSIEKNKGKSIL
jgi:hypothetical protein